MLRLVEDLAGDWRRLDVRIEDLSGEIEALAQQDQACVRLMTVPGIAPLISSAMVAAIGAGDVFSKGRDFGAWLGLVGRYSITSSARASNVGGTERVGRKAMAPGRARGHRAFARSNVSRTSDVSGRSRARRR
jgi:transposase